MKVSLITDEIGGIGGASATKVKNLVETVPTIGVNIKVFGFKFKSNKIKDENLSESHESYYFLGKTTNSSILNSLILFLKSPLIKIDKEDIIHVMRTVHALPFILRPNVIISEERGRNIDEMRLRHSRLLVFVYTIIERIGIKFVNKIVVVDRETQESLQNRHGGIIARKTSVIPVGVDLTKFKPIDLNKIYILRNYNIILNKGDKTILYIGRLDPVKNLKMLLRSFKVVTETIEDCSLIIVGEGKEKKDMIQLAKQLKIHEKVFFIGFVPNYELPKILNVVNVFALTSIAEGSPNTPREAIACGLPVVSTNAGDVTTFIKSGFNGYVVNGFNPNHFAEYLIKSLNNEKTLRHGCLKTREKLSLEKMVEKYEKVFEEATKQDKRN